MSEGTLVSSMRHLLTIKACQPPQYTILYTISLKAFLRQFYVKVEIPWQDEDVNMEDAQMVNAEKGGEDKCRF